MNRLIALLTLLAGIMAGVYLIGNRLAPESLAVIVGVICGVGAGVPSALLIMLAGRMMRRLNDTHPVPPPAAQPMQPQVIVVGPQSARLPPAPDYGLFADSGRRWIEVADYSKPAPVIVGEAEPFEFEPLPAPGRAVGGTFADVWGEELAIDEGDPTRPDLPEDSYSERVGPDHESFEQVGPGRAGGRRPPTEAELEAVSEGMSIRQMRIQLGIGYERAKWLIEGGSN